MLEASYQGLLALLTPDALIYMSLGVAFGLLVGFLPALGGITAMALVLPFAVTVEPAAGLALLLGAHVACIYGDTVCSILFNVPGSAKAIAHCFDGYPMTQRGEGARALGAAATASFLGGIIGAIALTLTLPMMRAVMLALGPPEYFMMAIWGLSVIAIFSEGSVLKGLVAAGFGILVSFVGMDPVTAVTRFTFGNLYLMDGFEFPVAAIGLFAISQVIKLYVKGGSIVDKDVTQGNSSVWEGVRDTIRHWRVVVQSSILGLWIGALPGIGATVGGMAAYGQAMQTSKHPEEFGKGNVEGVIAPTATIGANEGGGMMPTLGFGVPGGESMAILLSAFITMGVQPGQPMLTKHLDLVFTMVWIIVLANMLTTGVGLFTATRFARVAALPGHVIIPMVLAICFVGAYSISGEIENIFVALAFGIIGYLMDKYQYSRADMAIGMVLGLMIERYLHISITTHGNLFIVTRPVTFVMALLVLFTVVYPVVRQRRRKAAAVPHTQSQ
ncbi:MAG: tripartite tricarboxylate transporter permease [Chloroflexota bacterium]